MICDIDIAYPNTYIGSFIKKDAQCITLIEQPAFHYNMAQTT